MAQGLLKFIVTLGIVAILVPACGQGTETGNPNLPNDPTNAPGAGSNEEADAASACPSYVLGVKDQGTGMAEEETDYNELIEKLCLNIFLCDNSIGTLHCIYKLLSNEGDPVAAFAGPDSSAYTANQLQDELRSGVVLTDTARFANCKTEIDTVACNEITTKISVDDFSQAADILPSSCSAVFVTLDEAALACP